MTLHPNPTIWHRSKPYKLLKLKKCLPEDPIVFSTRYYPYVVLWILTHFNTNPAGLQPKN
jgi:hypothetical protein